MSNNEGTEWRWLGSFVAFIIIGLFWGGIYCYNNFESTFVIILGTLGGGVLGLIIGGYIGDFLDWISGNETKESKQTYQNNKTQEKQNQSGSSKSSSTGNSEESKKKFEEAQKNAKINSKYYTLLESTPNDNFNTIRNNYHRLVRQYHPDFLGTNASEAMHKYAKEKSQEINEAFEIVKKQRGIK